MKLNYLKVYPTHFLGSPQTPGRHPDGDGCRGSALAHELLFARLVIKFPELPWRSTGFRRRPVALSLAAAVSGPGSRELTWGGGADPACSGYLWSTERQAVYE